MAFAKTMLASLCLFLSSGPAFALDYSIIAQTGIRNTCPGLDSCRNLPAHYAQTHLRTRNCECDSLCGFYRDCCIDATPLRNGDVTVPLPFVCMEAEEDREGVYVVGACPDWYAGELRSACEGGAKNRWADPLLSTPVTARDGTTYLNRHCARCNGVEAEGVLAWKVRLDCPVNASWVEVRELEGGGWGARGQRCELHFEPHGAVGRRCRAGQIAECRKGPLADPCALYMSEVVDGDMSVFRNAHCALCAGRRVEGLACAAPSHMGRRGNKKPFAFALLLDVNAADGAAVGSEECPEGQLYDPFFKKCREMTCGIPGFKLKQNKCVRHSTRVSGGFTSRLGRRFSRPRAADF